MKTFVIAYAGLADDEIHMKEIEAHSLYEAMCVAYEAVAGIKYEGVPTAEDVRTEVYDEFDGFVNALQVGGI